MFRSPKPSKPNGSSEMTPLTRQLHEMLNIGCPSSAGPPVPFTDNLNPYMNRSSYPEGPSYHDKHSINKMDDGGYKGNLARAVSSNPEHSFFATACDTKWAPSSSDFDRASFAVKPCLKNDASLDFYNSFKNDHYPKLWEGDLERRDFNNGSGIFSKKIFIGGIPRDMTEEDIISIFSKFDTDVRIEWPESRPNIRSTPKGYLYIILSTNENVRNLLYSCDLVYEGGCETFNFDIIYKKKLKQLQVIPWLTSDSHFKFGDPTDSQKIKFTVFIGALHGRLHAKAIAFIFNKMFGEVLLVTIDTDRHKYPTGSGRITFASDESYKNAISANFIQIEAKKVSKKVQIEPCIDGQKCYLCLEDDAPNFCKEPKCFEYYCNSCWGKKHSSPGNKNHIPIRRKSKFEY